MHRVSTDLYKHEWKFVGEREMLWEHQPLGEHFQSLFEFSQIFTSVFIAW